MKLTNAEIEACYAEGRGMLEFARKVEAAVIRKMKGRCETGWCARDYKHGGECVPSLDQIEEED